MADCPALALQAGDLFEGIPDIAGFDPPTPGASGPLEVYKTSGGGGVAFVPVDTAAPMSGFRIRLQFTDPTSETTLMPFGKIGPNGIVVSLFDIPAPPPIPPDDVALTVTTAPGGAGLTAAVINQLGAFTSALLAPEPTATPGTYDVTLEVTFVTPLENPVIVLGFGVNPDHPITIVSWSWVCDDDPDPPDPPGPEPTPFPPVECLGTGLYEMDIVRRPTALGPGGPFLPGPELELLGGNWTRKLGTSTAGVTFAADASCCESIAAMMDLAVLELELYRNDSRSVDNRYQLVWAGPVTDLLDNRDGTFLLTAADVSYYVTDERVAGAHVWTAEDLAVIFADVITDALAVDNPGISIVATPTGIRGDRSIAAGDAKPVGQVLGEITRTAVDWTVVGREWRVGGQQIDRATILPIQLHDEHFADPPKIRVSRSAMATRQLIRGNGVVGSAGGARDDGVLIEKVADENGIIDQPSADAAAATLWDRVHEPVTVIEGTSHARLDPDTPVDIQTLIPGIGVPVSVGDCLTYVGLMRLESVSVDFGTTENVAIALQPVGTGALS